MNKLIRIQQGESLPFRFDRDGADIGGWVCTIVLKKFPPDVDLLTGVGRVIPPVHRGWPGFLTNSETGPLAIGLYYLTATLINIVNNELEQIPVRVSVTTKWA